MLLAKNVYATLKIARSSWPVYMLLYNIKINNIKLNIIYQQYDVYNLRIHGYFKYINWNENVSIQQYYNMMQGLKQIWVWTIIIYISILNN